jgi:hypothetical protein
MVTGRVGQGAACTTPMAATRPAKVATMQFLSILILFLFVDFDLPLAAKAASAFSESQFLFSLSVKRTRR